MTISKNRPNANSRKAVLTVLMKLDPHCGWCRKPTRRGTPDNQHSDDVATVDHIVELRNGGLDKRGNRKLSCRKCNMGRDLAGGCIGALACARALGKDTDSKLVAFFSPMPHNKHWGHTR